jgi:two-component system, OmpR family, sensor histidine kinase MtrB
MDDAQSELEELRAREQAMARFVALAAHELRAPATVVHGVAATMAARPDELSGERGPVLVGMLYEQSHRLVRLLDQLLDLSRLDAEAVDIDVQRFEVRPHVVELVETVAGERASDVDVQVDDALEANLDPQILDRILGNLVTNALRHGEPPVRVAADQTDRHFRMVVEDCGRGVDPELRERLFDRFSSAAGSTGLGLAIAQSYAQAHGGRILYEPGGAGARFRVVIPAPPPA